MKKNIILSFIIIGFLTSKSQDYVKPVSKTTNSEPTHAPDTSHIIHSHKGFYLSMALGPVFGNITDAGIDPVIGNYNITFSRTGAMFDFKIGGAVTDNLIIHATLMSSSVAGPSISGNGNVFNSPNNLSIGEGMIGGGLTYYIMPSNIFLSGSIGSGLFTLDYNTISTSTQRGFSYQLKGGKEWYVSRKWGLGIALSFSSTSVNNGFSGGAETLNSGRFAVLFNATLN